MLDPRTSSRPQPSKCARLRTRILPRAAAAAIAGAALLLAPRIVAAQISGSWITDADGSWTVGSHWSSAPNHPTAGGTATFGLLPGSTGGRVISVDGPSISLSTLAFESPFAFTVQSVGASSDLEMVGPSLLIAADGPAQTPTVFDPGHLIAAHVSGTSGLTKDGPGSIHLTGNNTFSGGITINSGALYFSGTGDSALGEQTNNISLANGAALGYLGTSSITINRSVLLDVGGGEIRNVQPMTITGVLTGDGGFTKRFGGAGASAATLTLTGMCDYTGATAVRDDGILTLSGAAGALSSTSQIRLNGGLVLNNVSAANTDRVGNSTPIQTNGGTLQLLGNGTTSLLETVGTITLDGGGSVFNISTGSVSSGTQLSAPALVRTGRSTALVRGDKLGAGTGNTFANFKLAEAPALVGGGGAPGTTGVSIVPWLLGNSLAGASLTDGSNSFMTYGADGLRPLNLTSEYVHTLTTATANDNVRLDQNGVATFNGAATVNSLIVRGFNTSGTGQVTVNSGAVGITATGGTHSIGLNFGSTEGILQASAGGTWSGTITGINGITKSGAGQLRLTGANTYTGTTTIVQGVLQVGSDVTVDGTPGPLGQSTTAIEIHGSTGAFPPRLMAAVNTNVTIVRDLVVNNPTDDSIGGLGTNTGFVTNPTNTLTYDGQITVNGGALRFEADPSPAMQINGVIYGNGRLTDAAGSAQVLFGVSEYTGGTNITSGTWYAGSEFAFGLGSIMFSNTAAPTAANPLPGAIAAFGGPRTIGNPILVAASGPNSGTTTLLGMVIRGGQQLTMSGPVDLGGAERTITVVNEGTLQTSGVFSGDISRGGIAKGGDGRLVLSGANSYTGNTVVNAGTLVFGRTQTNTALIVNDTARAEISAGGNKLLAIRTLSLAGGATPTAALDVFDNDVKIGTATYGEISALVSAARNFGGWDQPGITSTTARTNPDQSTTLGVLSGAEYLEVYGSGATFDDVPVTEGNVVVKYTWYGDADLNGLVEFDDYVRTDFGFNTVSSGWLNGDFDLNGLVEFDDYVLLDLGFNTQNGTLRSTVRWLEAGDYSFPAPGAGGQAVFEHTSRFGSVYVSSFLSQVPEPRGVLISVICAGTAILARRRFF